ncbi:MAG: cardiolipin synthase ClsB [Gallionellaceae bacterium]|jgi:cardiolipin synthase
MSTLHNVAGHQLTLLCNADEYFPSLLAEINAAQHSIYFETYIFAADGSGSQIKEALQNAAQRKVTVHVLLDGFGSADFPLIWLEDLQQAGVKVLFFRPELARLNLNRRRLRRLHRKLVLIDQRVAYVGGINVINEEDTRRLDFAVQVIGPVVEQITYSMQKLWQLVAWMNFRRSERITPHLKYRKFKVQDVVFLIRDNLRHRLDIEHAYLLGIKQAKHEIIIANAYFLPGRRFRRYLKNAAKRGVRIKLLLQGKVEYRLQHYATLALYDELLKAGIEIHEYTQNYLHAKVAVFDSQWATVGSTNIDPFSLWLAREANLFVKDAGFAGELRNTLLHEMQQGSHHVVETDWQRRSIWMKIVLRVSYSLVRFLVGISGNFNRHNDI